MTTDNHKTLQKPSPSSPSHFRSSLVVLKMPLGERGGWDKSESRYCGVETEFNDDMPNVLSLNLSTGGFDFVVASLMDPSYRPSQSNEGGVLPFACSDLVLSPSQWSSHVVGKNKSCLCLSLSHSNYDCILV